LPGETGDRPFVVHISQKSCRSPHYGRDADGVGLVLKVACLYIQFPSNDFHHAIYIPERTICELRDQILRKVQIHTRSIFHQNGAGSNILVFVRQIPDRQVMIAEFLDPVNIHRDVDVILKYQCTEDFLGLYGL
jgi:hypothetical protein